MRIGLFGCTCDPIHFGHLNLAVEAFEKNDLDEVWLFPTGVNPFKIGDSVASPEERLMMAEQACQHFPMIKVRDDEIRREGVSYAIDTVRALQEEYDHDFFLILGDDAADKLSKWKEVDELLGRVDVIVGRREKRGDFKSRILEISSSEIRMRIKHGLCCAHLLPLSVLEMIHQEQIYI